MKEHKSATFAITMFFTILLLKLFGSTASDTDQVILAAPAGIMAVITL